MEELHRIHKDVPFGYWAMWIVPAYRAAARWLRGADVPGCSRPDASRRPSHP